MQTTHRPTVFVAPFLAETTLRFVRAAAGLPGVALGLVSQEPAERLPAELRSRGWPDFGR